MSTIATKTPRVEVVDALRGFAVMAILLVHCMEHFIYPVFPDPASQPHWLNVLDKGIETIIFSLFMGKSYAIFAILFGFTYYIQYTNQQRKGKDFAWRFFWRLILLVGFAVLNSAMYPGGDVLLLFSIVGLVLILVRKWSNTAILIFAIIMLIQPVEWFHYVMSWCITGYTLPDLNVGGLYGEVFHYTKEGNWGDFLWANITTGQKASLFWAVGAGRYMQTAGLFMMGYLVGRKQLFVSSDTSFRFWQRALIIAAIAFGPMYQLKELVMGDNAIVNQTVGVAFDMYQTFAFTVVIVSSFVLLYQTDRFKQLTFNLRYYGKMSLTNYVTQSSIGA